MNSKELTRFVAINIGALAQMRSIKIGDLEEKVHVSRGTVSRIKAGNKVVSLPFLVDASKELKVSLVELLTVDFTEILKANQTMQELNEIEEQMAVLKARKEEIQKEIVGE